MTRIASGISKVKCPNYTCSKVFTTKTGYDYLTHAIECKPLYKCENCDSITSNYRYLGSHNCRIKFKKELVDSPKRSQKSAPKKKGFGASKEKKRTTVIKNELSNVKSREMKSGSAKRYNVFDFDEESVTPSVKSKPFKVSGASKSPGSTVVKKSTATPMSTRKRTTSSVSSAEDTKRSPRKLSKVFQKKEVLKPPTSKVKKVGYGFGNHSAISMSKGKKSEKKISKKAPTISRRKRKLKNVEDTTPTEMSLSEEDNDNEEDDLEDNLFTPVASPMAFDSGEGSPQHPDIDEVTTIFFLNIEFHQLCASNNLCNFSNIYCWEIYLLTKNDLERHI